MIVTFTDGSAAGPRRRQTASRTRQDRADRCLPVRTLWLRGGVTSVVIPRDEPDGRLSLRRRLGGFAIAIVGVSATSIGLLPDRERIGLESILLIFVLLSVIASAVGGMLPAVTAAVLGFFAANLLFTPPYNTLYVQQTGQLMDLILFLAIAAGVGFLVEATSRARQRAARARTLATAITELDHREYGDHNTVERLLMDILDNLNLDRAELLADGTPVLTVGIPEGEAVAARLPAGDRLELRLFGAGLHDVDAELLAAYGNTAGRLWRSEQFAIQAIRADETAQASRQRSDQLAAAIRDLTAPVAEIRAGISSIRERSPRDLPGLAAIEGQLDRLEQLIANGNDAHRPKLAEQR